MEDILRQVYNYPALTDHDLELIIGCHTVIDIPKGHLLLKEGQQSRAYWILSRGCIRSYVIDYEGQETTTGFFTNNDVVIEVASLFKQIPTLEYIQTITDCTLYQLNFDEFQKLFVNIPAFAEWGRMWMTTALTQMKDRTIHMITRSAQQRYITLMEEHPEIIRQVPLKYIASYLGITDSSLSRIRKVLLYKGYNEDGK